ncbi:hypothetical protein [Paracoccus seriniphilus]|uniref:Uncharacterized protein n=1 Tax=Paracoccus seriniphilus TaxID=184748 RepID=A0A239Q0Y5_9RHOB|nr:hypothetical protein [Paracoccus seriniphilus]WCR15776.1 hypothetical protein JHW44_14850 [Paracoccus seriniphilus]SNT76174.1 hypothetical protein SAMN05444959_11639 [Paracoccus seriniphilus]
MSGRLVILALAATTIGAQAQTLASCRDIPGDRQRLACYDRLPLAAQGFRGAGSGAVGPISVAANTWLYYESDDAVMVLYLMSETGEVVQNLHRAGPGRSSHLIAAAGRYRLQINATGGWRVSLSAAEPTLTGQSDRE